MTDSVPGLLEFDESDSLLDDLKKFNTSLTLTDISSDLIVLAERWEPTEEALKEVFSLAQRGCSEETIARVAMKVSDQLYFELKAKHPVIEETIVSGRRNSEAICATIVFQSLMDPSNKSRLTTAQFMLKNRHRWSETLNLNPVVPVAPTSSSGMSDEKLIEMLSENEHEPEDTPAAGDDQDGAVAEREPELQAETLPAGAVPVNVEGDQGPGVPEVHG